MKVLGISIEANKAIFCSLHMDNQGNISEIAEASKKMELKDHLNSKDVRNLLKELHAFFDQEFFDQFGIITRGTKGRFAASPISFKIEGLIQAYPTMEIKFVAPATLRAFYKNNENPIELKYTYQNNACDLAFYLLKN